MADRNPDAIRAAAELCAREPTGVEERRLRGALRALSRYRGEEWEPARDAVLGALGAVRKARGGEHGERRHE